MTMKNFLAILVLWGFPSTEILEGVAWSFSGSGSGSEASPFVITNATQLQEMNLDLTAHYILANDIDASETALWNGGAGYEPVGDRDNPFAGSLNGQGSAITGLFINRPSSGGIGLFRNIDGATVQSVALESCSIMGRGVTGALVADFTNGRVSNCYSTGVVNGSGTSIDGGIVGGLVGRQGRATVSACYSACAVSGPIYIGGLVGYQRLGTVSNSYSMGPVSGGEDVGGLIGYKFDGTVSNCYSTGTVSEGFRVGGLMGSGAYNVTACYWDVETSGQASSAGGTGKTTSEMYQQATFAGWDFSTFWWIDEGNDYPRLYWEPGSPIMPTPTPATSDFDGNGSVDANDLLIFLSQWKKVTGELD